MGIAVLILLMGWEFEKWRGIEKKRKKIKGLMQLPFMSYSCESVLVCFIYAQELGYCLQWDYSVHMGQCKALLVLNVR